MVIGIADHPGLTPLLEGAHLLLPIAAYFGMLMFAAPVAYDELFVLATPAASGMTKQSPGQIIFKLVDIVSKGGNYLLNVGPMSDGVIPPASQDVLRTAGRWLQMNGEAIYGAGPTPFGDELGEISRTLKDVRGEPLGFVQGDFRYTTKPGKLYITFFTEPRVPFALPAMKTIVTRAYYLGGDRGAAPIKVRTEGGRTILDIERPIPDPMASVAVVEFQGDRIQR